MKKTCRTATSYKLQATGCSRGVTLIDTLVGSALMLVVFIGIAGVFKLSIDVVTNNKARAGAIALADDRIEYIRSLAYSSIGTSGGIPSGAIAQSETIVSNGVSYTRRTTIEYADDPGDGLDASDTNGITLDYKVARADLAWESRTGTRYVTLVTRITPPSGMETACPPTAECGTLTVTVLDAELQPVSNAQVHVVNTVTSPEIDLTTFTNTSGIVSLVGAPASTGYQITVTKTGYSTDQTYSATAQNTNPTPGPFTVSNNQTTSPTFRIDQVSAMTVSTFSLSTNTWSDSFANESKIGPSTNIEISGNRARFAGIQPWTAPADLRSQTITPVALSRWGVFSWNDTQPSETTITYRVYYPNGSTPTLVPDAILPGNSSGFTTGTSIDLSTIPAAEYPSLILDAYLVALNPSAPSPSIEDWGLTYQSGEGIVIPFTVRGAKTIGSGPNGTIYKYDQILSTDSSGILSIPNMEWDSYTMTVAPATGYDLASSCIPQPIVLAPNTSLAVQLYFSLHTSDSLLVDVKSNSGSVLSGATIQLTKGGSYDRTIIADACGQAFFDNLTNGNYSISISAVGFQTYSVSGVNVTGSSRLSVTLN